MFSEPFDVFIGYQFATIGSIRMRRDIPDAIKGIRDLARADAF